MFAHTIDIRASTSSVWAAWRDVAAWPVWDREVRAASLPDGLVPGSQGWLQPTSGPKTAIRVSEVTATGFVVESSLPLCTMHFAHTMVANPGSTRVTHDIRFTRLLAPVFSRLVGRTIAAGLPATLEGLKRHLETRQADAA